MLRQFVVAIMLAAPTLSVQASQFREWDDVEVQEYVVRERHWNDWDRGTTFEYHYRDRRPPAWGRHGSFPKHSRHVFREYCPPPVKVYRGRVIERIESPRFEFHFDYRGR